MSDSRPEPSALGAQPYPCPHSDEGKCTLCAPDFVVHWHGVNYTFTDPADAVRFKAAEDNPNVAARLRARAERRERAQ